jgi:hypothetical protein
MNEIRIPSFLRPRQSKREAARQLTSNGKNAQNIFSDFNITNTIFLTRQGHNNFTDGHYAIIS